MNTEFIKGLIDDVERVERTTRNEFGGLTADQLNRRPGEGRWSVGDCLNHVITANEPYFPIFERVGSCSKETTIWERLPLVPGLCGSLVLKTVEPSNPRKTRAPKVFAPPSEPVSPDIVERYCTQQRELTAAIETLQDIDLDRVIVTSPVARFITYSLRHALLIVVRHEDRHLIQAQNVLRDLNAAAPRD